MNRSLSKPRPILEGRSSLPCGLVLLVLVLGLACQKNVRPHPNQINSFDGQTYDTLISAQAALDAAKAQYKSGRLPESAKPIINDAGSAYEQARTSWQLWRDITLGLKPGDPETRQAKVRTDMQQLAAAIANLRHATGGQ